MSIEHVDLHTYKCPHPECGWASLREDDQTRHMRTHPEQSPFLCDRPGCSSRFVKRDELNRHKRRMHTLASTRLEINLTPTEQAVFNHGQSMSFIGPGSPAWHNATFMDSFMALPSKEHHDEGFRVDVLEFRDPDESFSSIRPLHPTLKRDSIPNLSECIRNIEGPRKGGGFCDIYVGELMREGRSDAVEQVAMKLLRMFSTEERVARAKKKFRREVDVWRSLCHPNVLNFYGTYEIDENRLYMVSPWAHGGNSLEYLRRNPTANRGEILQQTASALEYLHSGKDIPPVVHGDLKADNVLISETGDALLCDFGLSRYVEGLINITETSSTGVAGQIRFMAPELIKPPKNSSRPSKPTPASDVFAFASLMLQIYTEEPPFAHFTEVQAMFEIVNGELPPRPTGTVVLGRGLHDGIWKLIIDCWRFDAEKRPTMKEVASRLVELV